MKKQIIFGVVTFLMQVSIMAQDWATVDIINEELKGMMFSAKIDYAPDCEHATPFIRATLHSITVDRFTYNGEEYYGNKIQGVEFPIEVTGYLSISTRISMGYHKDQRTYDLNKTSLSTSIGGKGNEFMADEFRFADGETAKLKEHLNISSCVDLKANATYLAGRMEGGYIEVHDGDLRYKDQSLHLYLKNKLEKQLEQQLKFTEVMEETAEYLSDDLSVAEYKKAISKLEGINTGTLDKYQKNDIENRLEKLNDYLTYAEEQAIEKKYDYLNTYRVFSNKQTPDFYENGIKKAEELIKNTKNKQEKAYLESLVQRIRYNYDAAEKNKASRDNLKAELKRDENKRKMEKTRLNQEQIKRLNAQMQYLNKVRNLESQGFNSEIAHKMAQNESKIQAMDELGTSVSKAVAQIGTDLIYAAFDKKEREYKENWAKFEAFRDAFENKVQNIREASTEKNKAIRDLPMTKEMSDNIPDLMQEVLWYVENVQSGYGVSSFEYPSGWGSVVSYGKIITQTTVDDAYFEGDKLFIQVTKKCLEASYDKDNLKRSNIKKVSPQPAKYTLKTKIEYDLNTAQTKTYRNIHWVGRGYYPAANAFEESNNFRTKVKNFDKALYAPPNYDKTVINVYARRRLKRIREITKREEIDGLKSNPEFIRKFEKSVALDLEKNFNTLYNVGIPNLITSKNFFTSNPDEVSMIVFWMHGKRFRYMILGYPGKQFLDKINPSKISHSSILPLNNNFSFQAKINAQQQNFYLSEYNKQDAIGGGSGLELLLSGINKTTFDKNIFYYNYKNRLVSETVIAGGKSKDMWNPIIEVGDARIMVEKEYIQDHELLGKFKGWVDDMPIYAYRKEPTGLVVKLYPIKRSVLVASKLCTYNYVETIKAKYEVNNKTRKTELLYYKPAQTTNHLMQNFYRVNPYSLPMSHIIRFDPLSNVSSTSYSEQFLNNHYKNFKEYDNKSVWGSEYPKGTQGRFYKMFSFFNTIDFSDKGVKYKGRNPTFYANGNLKTLGNTKDGKKIGEWEYYHSEGFLHEVVAYDKFHMISWAEKFNKNGEKTATETYLAGIIDIGEYFDPDKKELRVVYYQEGIMSSEDIFQAESIEKKGKHIETREYEDGILLKTIKH